MKKKLILVVTIFFLILGLSIYLILYKEKQIKEEMKAQARYSEIKESVKKAVEWNINAQLPSCPIVTENKEANLWTYYNSSFLIKNGYIKKNELLDVDNKSYCSVYVEIYAYFENPLDHQNNCEAYHKIYLKCKNYKDKGYKKGGLDYT